jgi:hypothetical protein
MAQDKQIFCKECNKHYQSHQLTIIESTPFKQNISPSTFKKLKQFLKHETGNRKKITTINHPGFGGIKIYCPAGHLLRFHKTWIS